MKPLKMKKTIRRTVLFDINPDEYLPIKEKIMDCRDCCECCKRFLVPLSPIETLKYKIGEYDDIPFLAKKEDGSCFYLKDGRCSIYNDRPIACREYSCENDEVIGRVVSCQK